MPDDLVPILERKAKALNITRHKAIMDLVRAWVAVDVLVLEQSEWPTTEEATVCPECMQLGPHCNHKWSFILPFEKTQTRVQYVCICPKCAPGAGVTE